MGEIASRMKSSVGDMLLIKDTAGWIRPRNFIISGGIADERHAAFLQMFGRICGRIPLIYLHSRDDDMIDEVKEIAEAKNQLTHLHIINANADTPDYGYLNSVSQQGIVNTLELIAKQMDYDCPPQFDRTVKIMNSLAKEFGYAEGLAGLSKLASLSYVELRGKIREHLGSNIESALANDMEVSGRPECFYLFQAVVQKLAYEAKRNGGAIDGIENSRNIISCIEAINNRDSLFLELRCGLTELIEQCICSELKESRISRFLLVIDGIRISQNGLGDLINSQNFKWGLISEDVFPVLGEKLFAVSAEKAETIMVLKHKTGPAAEHFSELIGSQDIQMNETSEGTAKEAFKILPGSTHKETRYSIENRFRVMPERIMELKSGEAILFDTTQNRLIIV